MQALSIGTLAAAIAAAAGAVPPTSYAFGPGSEIDYHVVHPMHHVKGVSHALAGKVTLADGKLVTPLTLTLPLLSFSSGNANRDGNAANTLDVARFPVASLEVQHFAETAHTVDATGLHLAGTATGRLSLHGLSHAVTIPLTGKASGAKLTVDGEFTLNLTDYGIPRPSLLFKPIEDQVRVVVHGVGQAGGG